MKKLAATLAIVTLLSCRNSMAMAEEPIDTYMAPEPDMNVPKPMKKNRMRRFKMRKMPLDKRIELAEKRLKLLKNRLDKITAKNLKTKLETAIARREKKLARWKARLQEIKNKNIKEMPIVEVMVEETEMIPEGAIVTVEALEQVPEVLEVQEVQPEEIPAVINEEMTSVTVD